MNPVEIVGVPPEDKEPALEFSFARRVEVKA